MTKTLDFYFDFISPYSYLAHQKLKLLNKDNNINVIYKPILLGGLHNLSGITPAAFNELKMKNMKSVRDRLYQIHYFVLVVRYVEIPLL